MPAIIKSVDNNKIKIEVEIFFKNSMLDTEEEIQVQLNEVGTIATKHALNQFDTDGSPIKIGKIKLTSKGKEPRNYQTPYGETRLERHMYQTSNGGETYCPLENNARIIHGTTPKFAKMISYKYAKINGSSVVNDFKINHNRHISKGYIQNLVEVVATVAEAKEKEWEYATPRLNKRISTIAIGCDGTTTYITNDGYREAMVGTIALYDVGGNRLHTHYLAATPEYGKETFKIRLEKEILHVKKLYPNATYVGIADGAKFNWELLNKHTQVQNLDFFHVTEYLAKAAKVIYKNSDQKDAWLHETSHNLKHKNRGARNILKEFEDFEKKKLKKSDKKILDSVVTYFRNNISMMNYSYSVKNNLPIGSGVTEAACKVIVKQRLCNSGMRWGRHGAAICLKLRSMIYTTGHWEQFWNKINQYGVSFAC